MTREIEKGAALAPWGMAAVPMLVGSLDAYIQTVNRIPMLEAREERELVGRFREHDDVEAARRLLLSHLRMVVAIARGYRGYGLPHADLIQEGNIGLMKALKRFDPTRGVRLASCATHWIKAQIREYVVRNWRLVKLATTKAQRKLFFNLRSMKAGFAALTQDEAARIAAELNVKSRDVLEMETRLFGREVALDADAEEGHAAPISWLAADGDAEPLRLLENQELERKRAEALCEALSGLDQRSRRIVEARWLRGDGRRATLHALGAQFKVSAERIRQIEEKALETMRAALRPRASCVAFP